MTVRGLKRLLAIAAWIAVAHPEPAAAAGLALEPAMIPEGRYHGSMESIAYGAQGELRLADDRVRGVTDPEWFAFGRVGGFAVARLHARWELAGQAAWDYGADDFVLERAELSFQARRTAQVHAGIFLAPLGRTNLSHDAPENEFDERSLVATQLVGVPHAQLGVGVRAASGAGAAWPLSYEVDLVTGYDEGLVLDSPGGTRVPEGRNNYGDNNGVPALVARVAAHPSPTSEIGFAAQSGRYNETEVGGVRVDEPRWVHVAVADAASELRGWRLSGEAALALVDIPPGLLGLYAERQWGAALEVSRTLREPILRGWGRSSLTAALRADAVDFDRAIPGDSRWRLSSSLNLRQYPFGVTRLGWYYEIRRDRFNNDTPMAGITFSAASYF